MLKHPFAPAAIAAIAAGLLGLSPTPVRAEPKPPASVQPEPKPAAVIQPSPGKIVLLQYSYTPCGNDWSTRCEIRATADGAYYDIHHGFMGSELVESERLSDQDWATIKNIVLPAARSAKPERHQVGYRMGTSISLGEGRDAISLPPRAKEAYEQTRPGQRYLYWYGPGRRLDRQ